MSTVSAIQFNGDSGHRQYAGPIATAPAWVLDPGVRLRVDGQNVDALPDHKGTTCTCYYNDPDEICPTCGPAWSHCSTGRGDACRATCCA